MALIKCPECGREKVSDTAESCPECGYGIKAHFKKIAYEQELKRIAEEQRYIEEQQRAEEQQHEAENKRLELQRQEAETERIKKKIIMYIIFIIIGPFLLIFGFTHFNVEYFPIAFMSICLGIALLLMGLVFLSDGIKLLNATKHSMEEHDRVMSQIQQTYDTVFADKSSGYKCPNCGMNTGRKISAVSKSVSVGTLGLASDKIGKTYKCSNCNYLW